MWQSLDTYQYGCATFVESLTTQVNKLKTTDKNVCLYICLWSIGHEVTFMHGSEENHVQYCMNWNTMYEVSVWSFAPEPLRRRLKVQHYQDTILVKNLLTAVAQALCINKDSIQFFAIFEGLLLCPLRKLGENYMLRLPCHKSLSIQKWSFDVEKEKISLKSDMAALKLLRCQVLCEIQEGKLKPSQEEREKLEECNSFIIEHQFMSIIHSFKDYGAVTIENCEVITEITLARVNLAKRKCIALQLDLKGLSVITSKYRNLSLIISGKLTAAC